MQTAKLFSNGRSQAVRLPAEFRFEGGEVFIRRDPLTGDVVLSARKAWTSWDEFLSQRDLAAIPADFLVDRCQPQPQVRDAWPEAEEFPETRPICDGAG